MDDDWKLRAEDWKRMYQVKQKDWLDACDEIDALEAEIAELKAQLASPMLRCHKAGHQDEIDALKAENQKLREALKSALGPLEIYRAYGWPDRGKVIPQVKAVLGVTE